MPELGLSEDVFAEAAGAEPVARSPRPRSRSPPKVAAEARGARRSPRPPLAEEPAQRRSRRDEPRAARPEDGAEEPPIRRGAAPPRRRRPQASLGPTARGRSRPTRPTTTTPRRSADQPAPPFVGLTGGIGAGKSEALAALERLGAATLSSDAVVHELYGDPEVRDRRSSRAGATEVAPGGDGRPPRRSPARRSRGPRSASGSRAAVAARRRARSRQWRAVESQRDPAPPALVVEVPLLFESGMDARLRRDDRGRRRRGRRARASGRARARGDR